MARHSRHTSVNALRVLRAQHQGESWSSLANAESRNPEGGKMASKMHRSAIGWRRTDGGDCDGESVVALIP